MSVGVGWQQVASEAQSRLREHDDDARVQIAVGDFGIPRVRVDAPALDRRARRAAEADVQTRAMSTCELCGAPGSVRAGAVVLIWCDDCSRQHGAG